MNGPPLRSPVAIETPRDGQTDGTLIHRYRSGDESAATALYHRYERRLRALATHNRAGAFTGQFDADDVVQSVFRTFFLGIRRQTYDVPPEGDVWPLLRVLTRNAIRNLIVHHCARKRDARQQVRVNFEHHPVLAPDETAAAFLRLSLVEEIDRLPESNRTIVQMRISGYETSEIAASIGRSQRTVERVLQDFRNRLTERT